MAKRVWPMQPIYSNRNISRKRRNNMVRRLGSVCADTGWPVLQNFEPTFTVYLQDQANY